MNIVITRGCTGGSVDAIPAKAAAHRAFIAAALSGRQVDIRLGDAEVSQDIAATLRCLEQLGARIVSRGDGVWRSSPAPLPPEPLLDCGESGSTLRFLLPVAAALGVDVCFTGAGRLPERPLSDLIRAMKAHGIYFSDDKLPFKIHGKLSGGRFELPGNVSSQYISGLLFALYASGGSGEIALTTRLESARYVDMTVAALRTFGAEIGRTADGWRITGRSDRTVPEHIAVEGDWSNAAAFLVCGALSRPVTVGGLDTNSLQPDRAIVDILRGFGAEVTIEDGQVTAAPGALRAATVDVAETPDLLPVLAIMAAGVPGTSRLVNAARLRLKESDRLHSTAQLLSTLGAKVTELADALEITGGFPLRGGTADSCNDHRIVMAAAAAATLGALPLTINGADAISKSQPGFFSDYAKIGGQFHTVQTCF